METMHIDLDFQGAYYVFFYILAFQAGLIYLLYEGRRLNLPFMPWLLTILSSFLFFVIGCKIFMFTNTDWALLIRGVIPDVPGRTLIGGIIFGLGGILLGIRWFKLPSAPLDAFAMLVPITLLFQRIGCFVAGCCYGTPSSFPWSVTYGNHYHAYQKHVESGLIPSDAAASLPVHPVQLYEVAGCLLVIATIFFFRNRKYFHTAGSLLLASACFYSMVRFFDEFFRATHQPVYFELNKVQIYVLVMAIFSVILILLNERRQWRASVFSSGEVPFIRPVIFFVALMVIFSFSSNLVGTLEVVALYPIVILCVIALLYTIFTNATVSNLRWPSFGMICMMLVMMSQAAPEKENQIEDKYQYYTVAMSVLTGNHTLVDQQAIAEDCDGNSSYAIARFKEKYTSGGLAFSMTKVNGPNKLTYGIRSQLGKYTETGEDNVNIERSLTFYSFSPYLQYDMPYFGIGGGVHVGDIPFMRNSFDSDQATLVKRYRVYPQLYVRGGNLNTFFGEFRLGDGYTGAFPASEVQMTFGYGFHRSTGAAIRIGTSYHAGFIFSGSIPASANLLIEPYLGVGKSLFLDYDEQTNFQGALRLAYQFGRK